MEQWKDIKGFEEYYQVSNLGNVKSKDRYTNHNYGGLKLQKGKLRNPTKAGNYLKVDLYPGNKQISIHRLVAEHFIDNPNNHKVVMHKDNNPHNNSIDNLQWGSYSMNTKQCVKDNRHKGYENGNGKRKHER